MAARVVLGHDLVELLGVLRCAQVAVVGDCVLGQTMVTCFCDEGGDGDDEDDGDVIIIPGADPGHWGRWRGGLLLS